MKDLHTWVDIYFRDNDMYQISPGRALSDYREQMSTWLASLREIKQHSGEYTERRQSDSAKQNSEEHYFYFCAFRLAISFAYASYQHSPNSTTWQNYRHSEAGTEHTCY